MHACPGGNYQSMQLPWCVVRPRIIYLLWCVAHPLYNIVGPWHVTRPSQ